MSAGGSTKTQPGMGGQTAGRPMTPFSLQDGPQMGGMQGFNTGMMSPSQMYSQGGMGLGGVPSGPTKEMMGMPRGQGGGQMPQGFDPSQLSRMSSIIQGVGQMPQQSQFPQSMMPFQQSQGMAAQAPTTQNPMQQGLGGLGAYMGGGG